MTKPYRLPSIPYLRLRVTLEAEQPAEVPAFHGSMLRGAFGHALRRLTCTMGPAQECATCVLRRTCFYTRLFEPAPVAAPPPFLRGVDNVVRPYVFEPRGGAGRLAPGDPLAFDLLLFGQAIEFQAYAVLAIERMARGGLGKGRARFRLRQVQALAPDGRWQTLAAEGVLLTRPAPPSLSPPALAEPAPEPLALRFVTPLRLKVRNRLAGRPSVRDLVFNMLRRVLELAAVHAPGASVDWDFRSYLAQTAAVRVLSADLSWQEHERWSHRQNAAMTLGGVVGRLLLSGDLTPFLPLLRTTEVVHLGKGATFGLGKIAVEPAC
jgi:CRISPR-associated endoribonuclease Cas6